MSTTTKNKRRIFADNMLATMTLIVCSCSLAVVSQNIIQYAVSVTGVLVGVVFLIRGLLARFK